MKLGICLPHYGRPIETERLYRLAVRARGGRARLDLGHRSRDRAPRPVADLSRPHAGPTRRAAVAGRRHRAHQPRYQRHRAPLPVAHSGGQAPRQRRRAVRRAADPGRGGGVARRRVRGPRGADARAGEPHRRGARADPHAVDRGVPGDPDGPPSARRAPGLAAAAPETAPADPDRRQLGRRLPAGGPARGWLARLQREPRRLSRGGERGGQSVEGGRARRERRS